MKPSITAVTAAAKQRPVVAGAWLRQTVAGQWVQADYNSPMPGAAHDFLRQLRLLRWVAVVGQCVAVALAIHGFGMPLHEPPLWGGIAVLAAFNVVALASVRRRGDGFVAALASIAFDIVQLAWMIGWSGGAMNPFTSLFLLPVALVAVSFRPRVVFLTAAMSGAAYAAATLFAAPLPMGYGSSGHVVDMHLWGMAVNFLVSCAVCSVFLARLAATVRDRDRELARFRERFARNEGILALATHAASVAHELNTPLGALTLLVEDQLAQAPATDVERRAELEEMAQLVNACRDRVRELSAPADGESEADVRSILDGAIERWRLLRPTIALQRAERFSGGTDAALDPAVGHLLQVLLNNAADASEAAGSDTVALDIASTSRRLVGRVRDFGRGIERGELAGGGVLFRSTKPDGLGIGLALSHATLERLGGALSLHRHDDGGTEVVFEVPLVSRTP